MPYEVAIDIPGELRIVTENSIWLVRSSTYMRTPRDEQPRRPKLSMDDSLIDIAWHAHQGVWVNADLRGYYLRILPASRPPDFGGITTGTIEHATGIALTRPS